MLGFSCCVDGGSIVHLALLYLVRLGGVRSTLALGTEGHFSVLSVFSTSLPWAPSLLSREPGTWKLGGTGQASGGYGSDSDHDLYLGPSPLPAGAVLTSRVVFSASFLGLCLLSCQALFKLGSSEGRLPAEKCHQIYICFLLSSLHARKHTSPPRERGAALLPFP